MGKLVDVFTSVLDDAPVNPFEGGFKRRLKTGNSIAFSTSISIPIPIPTPISISITLLLSASNDGYGETIVSTRSRRFLSR